MINQYEVNLEKAIKDSLSFIRNDAGFKIPKLLNVLQSIQEYVYRERNIVPMDYLYFSASLENNNDDFRLSFLVYFQVLLKKISPHIPQYLKSKGEIMIFINENKERFSDILAEYEKGLLYSI